MDLWVREARLFKYGSGTGTNFSSLRAEGEALSGGGRSSGLMGFLKIGDRAAGAIKSGGTTRRAAKMVIVDADHPDIEDFINWKVLEEQKVASIVAGSKMHEQKLNPIFDAIGAWDGLAEDGAEVAEGDRLELVDGAAEIMPGRPPKIDASRPTMKAAYSPTRGSTPATKAKATASGTRARATVRPERISFLKQARLAHPS